MTNSNFVTLEPPGSSSGPAPATAVPASATATATHRMSIEGRPVVLKRSSGRLRSRARAEADVLARLGHGPVVELIARRETDECTDLVLTDAGPDNLAQRVERGVLDAGGLRSLLAATARAVADLHDRGWSHGAVCAEHVVVTEDGSVRLCSLGSARPSLRGDPDIAEDRRQLLALIGGCATAWGRSARHHGDRHRGRSDERRLHRVVAELGAADEPATASTIADRLAERAHPPGASAARGVRSAVPAGWWTPVRHHQLGIGVGVGIVVVAALVWSTRPAQLDTVGSAGSTRPPDPPSAVRPLATTCPPASDPPRDDTAGVDPDNTTAVDIDIDIDMDGDGCVEPVRVDARTVQVGSTWFELGLPGDVVAISDEECDGVWNPMLLRPSSGELFEFTELPGPDDPVEGDLRAVVPGAVELRPPDAARGTNECGALHLVRGDGADLGPAP